MALSTFGGGGFYDPLTDFFAPSFLGWPAGGSDAFGGGGGALAGGVRESRTVPVDFIERDNEWLLRADIPGVHKDELRISVDGNVLRIGHEYSERTKKDDAELGTFHRAERVSSFRGRALRMPESADLENIKAKYVDGVLSVACPKKPAAQAEGQRGKAVPIE